jgi:hypothetical protein
MRSLASFLVIVTCLVVKAPSIVILNLIQDLEKATPVIM